MPKIKIRLCRCNFDEQNETIFGRFWNTLISSGLPVAVRGARTPPIFVSDFISSLLGVTIACRPSSSQNWCPLEWVAEEHEASFKKFQLKPRKFQDYYLSKILPFWAGLKLAIYHVHIGKSIYFNSFWVIIQKYVQSKIKNYFFGSFQV